MQSGSKVVSGDFLNTANPFIENCAMLCVILTYVCQRSKFKQWDGASWIWDVEECCIPERNLKMY